MVDGLSLATDPWPNARGDSEGRDSVESSSGEGGSYKAKPSRVFRFEEIREAHRLMESNQAGGTMVAVI